MNEGDIVKLKSGGPDMVVHKIVESAGVWCRWFDSNGNPHLQLFEFHELKDKPTNN